MIKQLPQSVSKEELMAAVFAKGSTMRGLKADVGRLQAACRAASALDPHKRRASYSSADLNASAASAAAASASGGGVSPRRSTTHGQPAAAVATSALTSTESPGAGPSLASLSSRLRTKAPIPTPTTETGGDTSASATSASITEEAPPPPLPPKVWKPSSKSRIYSKTVDPQMYQSLRTRWLEQIEQRTKVSNAAGDGDGDGEADHTKSPPPSPSTESAGAAPPSPAFSDWIERLKAKSAADGSPSSGSVRALLDAQRGRHEAGVEAEAEKPKGSSVRVGLVSGHGFHKRTVIMQQRRKADEHKVLAQLHPQYAQTRYRLSFLIRANEDQGSEGKHDTTRHDTHDHDTRHARPHTLMVALFVVCLQSIGSWCRKRGCCDRTGIRTARRRSSPRPSSEPNPHFCGAIGVSPLSHWGLKF